MNIKINKWYGRLGNNIIQVKNAINIALHYNYNIRIPYHIFFNKRYIKINNKITKKNRNITGEKNFFSWKI